MSKETNLTSLKVYGNDDPAGSTYKVGGSESGSGLVLYVAEEKETANETIQTIQYLTHKDGSIATWREIHDALIEGSPVWCVMIKGTSPLQPKLRGPLRASGQILDTGYHVIRYSVPGADYVTGVEPQPHFFSVSVALSGTSVLHFCALTADERLEAAE